MTEYVVTRWYRAPEVLLRSCGYSKALDMWSVGCIFAELLNRKALFMGRDHAHQMCLILDMLGTPSDEEWQNVCDARAWAYFKVPSLPHPLPISRLGSKLNARLLTSLYISHDHPKHPLQRPSRCPIFAHGFTCMCVSEVCDMQSQTKRPKRDLKGIFKKN
jgi:serine/threonine protein kinase